MVLNGIIRAAAPPHNHELYVEFKPVLEYLTIDASPETARHIAAGVSTNDRWTLQQASLLLKRPTGVSMLHVKFYVPPNGKGRRIEVALDGVKVSAADLDRDGIYELSAPVAASSLPSASITIQLDKALHADGDRRELGVILIEAGFRAK